MCISKTSSAGESFKMEFKKEIEKRKESCDKLELPLDLETDKSLIY